MGSDESTTNRLDKLRPGGQGDPDQRAIAAAEIQNPLDVVRQRFDEFPLTSTSSLQTTNPADVFADLVLITPGREHVEVSHESLPSATPLQWVGE